MFTLECTGINSLLVEMSKILLKHAVERKTRGFTCYELPGPVMIKIIDPTARWVTIPARKWNPIISYAESLWLASGGNDLEFIKYYLPRMENFSDDKKYLRGAYGPRLRRSNLSVEDYKENTLNFKSFNRLNISKFDMLNFVVGKLEKDPFTRQAIINIYEPNKDCFFEHNIKETKDFPCTTSLHFMRSPQSGSYNKLDLFVNMRSNDFIWGCTGVNIFNYTFIQEYMAKILNMQIGNYYHMVNNMHYYERHKEMIKELASTEKISDIGYLYDKKFLNLDDFNHSLVKLLEYEHKLRKNKTEEFPKFKDDFFNDWGKILLFHKTNSKQKFKNEILNKITNLEYKKNGCIK